MARCIAFPKSALQAKNLEIVQALAGNASAESPLSSFIKHTGKNRPETAQTALKNMM